MKKIISLFIVSFLFISCSEKEQERETPAVEVPIVETPTVEIIDEDIVDEILTDEEIDKQLEEIFNID